MKRAKLVLALVATIGIVGGAFAVKAARFNGTVYYYTTKSGDVPVLNSPATINNTTGTSYFYTLDPSTAATTSAKLHFEL